MTNQRSALLQAREWREAVRVAMRHQRQDLLDTIIAPAAAAAAASTLEDVREDTGRVRKYWVRLKEVRAKRVAMQVCRLLAIGDWR